MKINSLLFLFVVILFFTCDYKPYSQGQVLYDFHCSNCHMTDGVGLKQLIPPLAKADYLKNNQSELACLIKNGIKGPITVNGKVFNTEMAGIKSLNDIQINNIINYINHSWGNDFGDSNVRDVKNALEQCP